MNTPDIAIICHTAVELAGIGAGLKVTLAVLPRLQITNPRQPRKTKTTTTGNAGGESE